MEGRRRPHSIQPHPRTPDQAPSAPSPQKPIASPQRPIRAPSPPLSVGAWDPGNGDEAGGCSRLAGDASGRFHELTEEAVGRGFCRRFLVALYYPRCGVFLRLDGIMMGDASFAELHLWELPRLPSRRPPHRSMAALGNPPGRLARAAEPSSPVLVPHLVPPCPPRIQPAPYWYVPRTPGPLHKPAQGSRSADRGNGPSSRPACSHAPAFHGRQFRKHGSGWRCRVADGNLHSADCLRRDTR